MKPIKHFIFALGLLLAGLVTVHPQQSRATTMNATVCAVAFFPCPAPSILDTGTRTNFIGTLRPNSYALLPFTFVDGANLVTGTVVTADFAGSYIYLVGFGSASSTLAGDSIDIAITQNYSTIPGIWTFGGFNIGTCNGVATADGDGVTSLPFVNGAGIGGPGAGACSPFAQTFGPLVKAIGNVTNLTATAIFGFNGPGVQTIGLPWGDDFPDPNYNNLTLTQGETEAQYLSDLQSDGLTIEVPEPATWAMMIFGVGMVGGALRTARQMKARTPTPA